MTVYLIVGWRLTTLSHLMIFGSNLAVCDREAANRRTIQLPAVIECFLAAPFSSGTQLNGSLGLAQANTFSPCFWTTASSLSAMPLGRFAPASHF